MFSSFSAPTLAGFLFSNNSSLNSLYCSLIFLSIYAIAAKLQSITSLSNFKFPHTTIGFIIITSHYNFMYSFATVIFIIPAALFVSKIPPPVIRPYYDLTHIVSYGLFFSCVLCAIKKCQKYHHKRNCVKYRIPLKRPNHN